MKKLPPTRRILAGHAQKDVKVRFERTAGKCEKRRSERKRSEKTRDESVCRQQQQQQQPQQQQQQQKQQQQQRRIANSSCSASQFCLKAPPGVQSEVWRWANLLPGYLCRCEKVKKRGEKRKKAVKSGKNGEKSVPTHQSAVARRKQVRPARINQLRHRQAETNATGSGTIGKSAV